MNTKRHRQRFQEDTQKHGETGKNTRTKRNTDTPTYKHTDTKTYTGTQEKKHNKTEKDTQTHTKI